MRPYHKVLFTLGLTGILAACAAGPEPAPRAAPKPTPEPLHLPFSDPRMMHQPSSPLEADQLVSEIEADWPPPAGDPLRRPQKLEDALAILKLDQRNLFAAALEVAKQDTSLDGKALAAQIELAWGESYAVLMDILLVLGNHFDAATMRLQTKAQRTANQEVILASLLELQQRVEQVVMLFQILNSDHTAKGAKMAGEVIGEFPESYLGYRLAADHLRVVHDWEGFAEMEAKIEAINPDSNGLRFLRGAAALVRDQDRATAIKHYRAAIVRDGNFVRVQAHLVMAQDNLDAMYVEFQNLKRINPNHQLVQWLDEAMELARSVAN